MNHHVPRTIRMQASDNVAIVVNDGGLPAGTVLPDGLVLIEAVPQGHKVALYDLADGAAVIRYGVTIGYADGAIARGSWVSECVLRMPAARSLDDLPVGTHAIDAGPRLEGYTFEGYRNKDGSVGTRNIMAITSTVQCVSGVIDYAVQRIKAELLPRYPNVEDVVSLEHVYGCGVAIDAPGAEIPIKTIRNLSKNPNFGDSVMVVSLGCEKLPPARLFPAGAIPIGSGAPSVVTLQDAQHVGFMSMVDSLMGTAEKHLQELNARKRETCPASDLVVGCSAAAATRFLA